MEENNEGPNSNYQALEVDNNKRNKNKDFYDSWYIISLFSWIIFLIAIYYSYHNGYFLWEFNKNLQYSYFPLGMYYYYLKIFVFLISLYAIAVFLIFTTFKRDPDLYVGMFGKLSKFHFIPLLCMSVLIFISRNAYSSISDEEKCQYNKMLIIFNIVFTSIGLISLLIVYFNTHLDCEWYIILAINKGLFSTLFVLFWYYIFYLIITLKVVDYSLDYYRNKKDIEKDIQNLYNVTGILFSILIGYANLIFSFLFKDIMVAFVNFLLYFEFVIFFFHQLDEAKKDQLSELFNGYTDGILHIIMLCLTVVYFVCFVFKYKQFIL